MTPDIKRILVPLDFSSTSRRALDHALGVALRFGASIHLIHVCERPAMMPSKEAHPSAFPDWSEQLGLNAEIQLAEIARAVKGVRVSSEVRFGHPAPVIVETATTHQVDLIVMGTHGHGALMRVVLGNVAERVVRSAPCPVLTVRGPQVREFGNAYAKKMAATVAAMMAVILLAPGGAAAQEAAMKQTTPGAEVFRTYCATCHGASARGDGPLASSMRRKPANLAEIARRNGGEFPTDLVFRTIDGRQPVRGHGGPDMPAWGDAFSRSREAGDADRVKSVIQSLVQYLESIQLRPGHEQ
jgi:nucleotide-binding universal stress UspA family protein